MWKTQVKLIDFFFTVHEVLEQIMENVTEIRRTIGKAKVDFRKLIKLLRHQRSSLESR